MTKRGVSAEDLRDIKIVIDPRISPDGRTVAFTVKTVDTKKNRYRAHLWLADVESGETRQFTHGSVSDDTPRWSPDGRRIAFVRTEDDRTQIWTMPADGGEASQLTKLDEGGIGAPTWSPDGSRLAFTFRQTHPDWTRDARKKREESGASNPPRVIARLRFRYDGAGFIDCYRHVWTCDAATGEATQLTEGDYDHGDPAWSPDGTRIALVANRGDDPDTHPHRIDLWLAPAGGGELERVPTPAGPKSNPAWSPSGERIAYMGSESGDDPWLPRHSRVWVVSPAEGGARCLTSALDLTAEHTTVGDCHQESEDSAIPRWSADGRHLYFTASDRGSCNLYSVAVADGQPLALTEPGQDIVSFSTARETGGYALLIGKPTSPPEVYTAAPLSDPIERVELRPLTSANAAWSDGVSVSDPEEVWFKGEDGTELQGWVMKPCDFDAGKRYPLLLYVHGGPLAQYGNTFFHEYQVHASRGYVVFYANPRGSTGYSEEFSNCIRGNWGDLDYRDVMATADFGASLPYVDPDRMALAGGSYGGFMTNWVVGKTNRFRCAITDRCISNLVSDFGTVDIAEIPDGYWVGDSWERPDTLWEQSPLRLAANIHTPLLIIHSEGDLRCPIQHSEQLFVALTHLGREVKFVRYPVETSHGMSRDGPPDLRVDRIQRIADWLDTYLGDS